MKTRRFIALMVSVMMVLSIVPVIPISAEDAVDETLLDYAKITPSVFDAENPQPTATSDTDVAVAYPESGITATVNNGYLNVNSGPRFQCYIGSSTEGFQEENTLNLPDYGEGNDWVLVSFVTEYGCKYGDVTFYDIDGKALTAVRYGTDSSNALNMSWGHTGWGSNDKFADRSYTLSTTDSITVSSGETLVDVLICNYDTYYTASIYVDGSLYATGTYTDGTFNGLGSIGIARQSGYAWGRISLSKLKIHTGNVPSGSDAITVKNVLDKLSVEKFTKNENLTLATSVTDVFGSSFDVKWESSNEDIITAEGVVTPPARNMKAVTLTPTVELNGTIVRGNSHQVHVFPVAYTSDSAHSGPDTYYRAKNQIDTSDISWHTRMSTADNVYPVTGLENTIENGVNIYTFPGMQGKGSAGDETVNARVSIPVTAGSAYLVRFYYGGTALDSGGTYTYNKVYTTAEEYVDENPIDYVSGNATASITTLEGEWTKVEKLFIPSEGANYLTFVYSWQASGLKIADLELYELEKDDTVREKIESVEEVEDIYVIGKSRPVLPKELVVTGEYGSVATGSVIWDEPEMYTVGDNAVEGIVTVDFKGFEVLTQSVSANVVVLEESFSLQSMRSVIGSTEASNNLLVFPSAIDETFSIEFNAHIYELSYLYILLNDTNSTLSDYQVYMWVDSSGSFISCNAGKYTMENTVALTKGADYRFFITTDARTDTYSLTVTDSDGAKLVDVENYAYSKEADSIDSLVAYSSNSSGNVLLSDIRVYAPSLTKEEFTIISTIDGGETTEKKVYAVSATAAAKTVELLDGYRREITIEGNTIKVNYTAIAGEGSFEVGDKFILDESGYSVVSGNMLASYGSGDGLSGWTNAANGGDLVGWESVSSEVYSPSGQAIHPTLMGNGNSEYTMRTFIPIDGGKTYYVTNTIYNKSVPTTSDGLVAAGMSAIVATGAPVYGSHDGLKIFSHVEYGGFNSWSNPSDSTALIIGSGVSRNDYKVKHGLNEVKTIIRAPEEAENIMITYGAWGSSDYYYGDFEMYEIVDEDTSVATIEYTYKGEVLKTVERLAVEGDEIEIDSIIVKSGVNYYRSVYRTAEVEKDDFTVCVDLQKIDNMIAASKTQSFNVTTNEVMSVYPSGRIEAIAGTDAMISASWNNVRYGEMLFDLGFGSENVILDATLTLTLADGMENYTNTFDIYAADPATFGTANDVTHQGTSLPVVGSGEFGDINDTEVTVVLDLSKYFETYPDAREILLLYKVTHGLAGVYGAAYEQAPYLEYVAMNGENNTYSVAVTDEDGNEVTEGYTINWYEKDGNTVIATGNSINVPAGKTQYEYEIILDDEMKFVYTAVERAVANTLGNTVVLRKMPSINITGKVCDENNLPMKGVSVAITQSVDDMTRNIILVTDNDGNYSAEILNTYTTFVYSYQGYHTVKAVMYDVVSTELDLGTRVMTLLPDNKIMTSISVVKSALEGEEANTTKLHSMANITFELYNETQKCNIEGFEAQYPYIVITDEAVNAGDEIVITAIDDFGEMTAACVAVELDEKKSAVAEIYFKEQGKFKLENITGNDENVVMIFNQDGKFIKSEVFTGSYTSPAMAEGEYSLVLMSKTNLLRSVLNIDKLSELGLSEGIDYALCDVTVTDGVISKLSDIDVPMLDEEKLYYTVADETNVTSSHSTLAAGKYTLIKVEYAVSDEYDTYGEKLRVELPEGVEMVEGSIALDGKVTAYSTDGNAIEVNVNKSEGVLRFYAVATQPGEFNVEAYLSFNYDGDYISQPVGAAKFTATSSQIEMSDSTGLKKVPIKGIAAPKSVVKIYDNGIYAGETKSNANGTWSYMLELNDTSDLAYHQVYAAVENPLVGVDVKTETKELLYREGYAEPEFLRMRNTAHPPRNTSVTVEHICEFDYVTTVEKKQSYDYWPKYPTFTFEAKFTGNRYDIWHVAAVTINKYGEETSVPLTYDEESGLWIGTHNYYTFEQAPDKVYLKWGKVFDLWHEYYEKINNEDVISDEMAMAELFSGGIMWGIAEGMVKSYFTCVTGDSAKADQEAKKVIDSAKLSDEDPLSVYRDYRLKHISACYYGSGCNCDDCRCQSTKPTHDPDPTPDPSGYVCEAVPSNRLEGVTVEAYHLTDVYDEFGEMTGEKELTLWDAEDYDQMNPLVTDAGGNYSWLVPYGQWLVKYSKDGYYDTDSSNDPNADEDGYLPVPPPQMDVNVAMVSMAAPEVESINAFNDSIRIEFTQYMDMDSINTDNVIVYVNGEAIKGEIIPVNNEASFADASIEYASIFEFVPEDDIFVAAEVVIDNVINYAGTAIEERHVSSNAVTVKPEAVLAEESVDVPYKSIKAVAVQIEPYEAGAGKKLILTSSAPSVASVEEEIIADENGRATFLVTGALPGMAEITVQLENTDLEAKVLVNVANVDTSEKCEKVSASLVSGTKVDKGELLELYCDTGGADIYYTTDKSDPTDENNESRMLYTEPIAITKDMTVMAYAVKDGYTDSLVTVYTYTVKLTTSLRITDTTKGNTVIVATYNDKTMIDFEVFISDGEDREVELEIKNGGYTFKIMEWKTLRGMQPYK